MEIRHFMSWVTVIWTMVASACFTLGAMYGSIWCRDRRSWANLCFMVLAVGVIGLVAGEIAAMYAKSPAEYGRAIRWGHFAFLFVLVGSVGFVHFYFGTGKWWLLWSALGLRLLAVVANFSTGLNLHISAIQSLEYVNFLGEPVSILGEWTPNPWVRLGQLAALVQFVYVVDASLRLWRNGGWESQRRAVIVGGTLAFFIIFSSGQAGLVAAGVLRTPMVVSLPFLAVLLAMGYELSRDVLRAAQLSDDLKKNEMRLRDITLSMADWVWEVDENGVYTYSSPKGFDLFGNVIGKTPFNLMPPDEAKRVADIFSEIAVNKSPIKDLENWNISKNGEKICFLTNGVPILDVKGNLKGYRGVDKNITERKQDEVERLELRHEITHLARVMAMNELSTSLAHEINQPLGAILNNASAAKILLSQIQEKHEDFSEILADIIQDTKRAGDVVRRIRGMVKKNEVRFELLNINTLIEEVVELFSNNIRINKVSLCLDLKSDVANVKGDHVHLQQVLLNLITNALEAMTEKSTKMLMIRSSLQAPDMVTISVSDSGPGIDEGKKETVFQPFFTTKKEGLGFGLSICRSIIEDHGGKIWAENNPVAGATFSFSLKAERGDSP
jgi:two-component system, LuxR family, sensor kinase FixL